jgi:HD superfamily phosphohydrolase YqeK
MAEYGLTYDDETVAIAALLHDICKVNCYKVSQRNVKGPDGRWQSVPYYEFDDQLPYGHGEKSVYIASGYMRLTREEAFAIRYHMGFSTEMDARNVGAAFAAYPLAIALYIADMEATYFVDDKKE